MFGLIQDNKFVKIFQDDFYIDIIPEDELPDPKKVVTEEEGDVEEKQLIVTQEDEGVSSSSTDEDDKEKGNA